MKKLVKGGLVCLLSCLHPLVPAFGQNNFVKILDPASEEFGKILSPELADSLSDLLITRKLSFPEWTSFYSVKITGGKRSVLGNYRLEKNRVAFTPRFLPDPHIKYNLYFNFNVLAEVLAIQPAKNMDSLVVDSVQYTVHQKSTSNEVSGIYPYINVLPENALKMYLYFTSPMGLENPYKHMALYDQEGKIVENAFVELPEGLWNKDRTRLTVLFHPGRVKQGVGPNLSEGTVLEEGKLFEFRVSSKWKNGMGDSLDKDFSKKFFVAKAQRSKLRKKDWVIESECKDECLLRLYTGDVPDIELIDDMVEIINVNGERLDFSFYPEANGSILIRSDEFKKGDKLKMIINPRMEDISGNSFLNAFDSQEGSKVASGKSIEILISIK